MTTYTKETALYDTGKIGEDISTNSALNFVTVISGEGIKVHPQNDTANYTQIGADGIKLYKDGEQVASFGTTARIGADWGARLDLSPETLSMTKADGAQCLAIEGSGTTVTSYAYYPVGIYDPYLANSYVDSEANVSGANLSSGTSFEVEWRVSYNFADYGSTSTFTWGTAGDDDITVGSLEFTLKYDGQGTISVTSDDKVMQPCEVVVNLMRWSATVEAPATTIGTRTSSTKGAYSTTIGFELNAQYANQVTVGKYNNNSSSNLFEVGKGTSSARSNAFAVASNGDVKAAGDVYPNNTKMADFVTEQGTSGIWRYRKWNSGIAECWGTYSASIQVTTSAAPYGGYRSAQLNAPNYPSGLFTAAPVVTMTASHSQGYWVNNVADGTSTNAKFYLSCGSSLSAATRGVHIHAMGKWK